MRWVGNIARMREMKNSYNILIRNPQGKRSLGRCRRRRKENIKMDLKKIWWEVVDWIHPTQDENQWRAVVNTGMNISIP
jgi:hypothetical protein